MVCFDMSGVDHSRLEKRRAKSVAILLPVVMIALTVLARVVPNVSPVVIVSIYGIVFIAIIAFTIHDCVHVAESDMSYALICPLSLSIFMNLLLSAIASGLSASVVTILLSSNILYCLLVSLVAVFCECSCGELWGMGKGALLALCVLTGYAVILFTTNPVTITSFLSTLRNLITPFSFLLLGSVLSKRVSLNTICDLIVMLGLVVVAFGLFELFIYQDFWINLDLENLWRLKGIPVSTTHLPMNFYSSEQFGGVHARRMTSLFADPVNLGTFLFCMFLVAWYRKRWIAVAAASVGCALTISKGALLGFLIWIFVYFLIKSDRIWMKRAALLFVMFAAAGFLAFSFANSTGSVTAHLKGAFGGIASIVRNPFGYGCGNVGVLASLANNAAMRGAEESGFGVIAGEVGVVGITTYLFVFTFGVRIAALIGDRREKIVALTLLLSIFANILFNEVALSPNSCGIYFSLLGVIFGACELKPRLKLWNRRSHVVAGVQDEE